MRRKSVYMDCDAHSTSATLGDEGTRPSIEVVYSRIEEIGKIFGVPDRAAELIAQMREEIAAVQRSVEGLSAFECLSGVPAARRGPASGISDRRFDFTATGGEPARGLGGRRGRAR
ncbi:MAG: hypothetical protein ACRD0K_09340 [Egibacteraceae bacterium]